MNSDKFNKSPFSANTKSIFPGDKGILLFYNDGNVKEIYGREHAIMMQEIGYWYTDNWQDFLLNFSYNGIIIMMIEFDTSLVYLPRDISNLQKEAFENYIKQNITKDKIDLISFYIMHCLEKNDNVDIFNGIKRDKRGRIKHISGKIINDVSPYKYNEICAYLRSNVKNDSNKLKR